MTLGKLIVCSLTRTGVPDSQPLLAVTGWCIGACIYWWFSIDHTWWDWDGPGTAHKDDPGKWWVLNFQNCFCKYYPCSTWLLWELMDSAVFSIQLPSAATLCTCWQHIWSWAFPFSPVLFFFHCKLLWVSGGWSVGCFFLFLWVGGRKRKGPAVHADLSSGLWSYVGNTWHSFLTDLSEILVECMNKIFFWGCFQAIYSFHGHTFLFNKKLY